MNKDRHDIEKYLRGELSAEEMHALEKKALNDPFLADALEGAELVSIEDFAKDVQGIQKKLTKSQPNRVWNYSTRIAAAITLLVASGFIIWQLIDPQKELQPLALEKSESPSLDTLNKNEEVDTTGELIQETDQVTSSKIAEQDQVVAEVKKKQPSIAQKSNTGSTLKDTAAFALADKAIAQTIEIEPVTEPVTELKPLETPLPSVAKEENSRARRSLAEEPQKKEAVSGAGYVASKRIIRGKVTSAEDGTRLPGVNVIVKGTTIGTVTNIDGAYEVEVSTASPTLIYSFIGLQSKEITANDRNEIDVQLQADMTQLSEVVVTGYGTSNQEAYSPTVDLAHPEIGYRDYKKYLEENIQYPQQALTNKIEGRVTIEFFVEPNGSLTDFQVIRGIGYGCDEELARLIKEGPSWVPTKKDNAPVRDKARIRLKFTLPKQK